MAEEPEGDKTEDPTAKRRKDAIEKGDVLQSKDLGTALVILAGAGWMALGGPLLVGTLEDLLRRGLRFDRSAVTAFDPGEAVQGMLVAVALPVVALFAMTLIAAIGTPAALGALGFRWSALAFKGNRINPMSGIKRIFGTQGLVELVKALGKIVVLGALGWWLLSGRIAALTTLGRGDFRAAVGDLGQTFVFAVLVMSLGLFAIAGADVPTQILRRQKRLRMTKQEVKEENKESEGSPELKGQIRRRQMEATRRGSRQAVSEASVVLTNPTHFAGALRYRPGQDAAPVVVARGRGATAEAIRALADEARVPMLRYPELTRALYFTTRAGHVIRDDLYVAVATVLAFVFNIDRAMRDGVRQPEVEVPGAARFDENGRKAPDATGQP
jgi:flagellar biosynthetic protein FlhB